jgi:hypothetical protein
MPDVSLVVAATESGDFFTKESLGSFTGAALATVVTGTIARVLTKRDLVLVPFLLAVLFAYVAAEITGNPRDVGDFLLIALNGCLLFWTALGANQTLASVAQTQPANKAERQRGYRPGWFDPWIDVRRTSD